MLIDLHQRGLEALRRGSTLEGSQLLGQALEHTKSAELWNDWACAMLGLERYQDAESGFRNALALDAHNVPALRNLLALMGDFAKYQQRQKDGCNRQYLLAQLDRLLSAPAEREACGRNLVVGLATGYSKKSLAPFVASLRGAGYGGDIVLFTNVLDRETRGFLGEQRVLAQPWDGMFLPFDMQLGRYVTFYNFLTRPETPRYNHVFLTDVRDVFFQADPFTPAPRAELEFFLEDDSRRVGSCTYNSTWVRMAFGEPTLQSMSDATISCSGTVMGTWRGIQEYLLHMQILAIECMDNARFVKGVDQGLHNALLSRKILKSCIPVRNGDRVFTLGYVPEKEINLNKNGQVIDAQGHVSPVIHQYDRHSRLAGLVGSRFQ